jgi:hypothetical protein
LAVAPGDRKTQQQHDRQAADRGRFQDRTDHRLFHFVPILRRLWP